MHIIIIHLMYWLKVMKRDLLPLKVIGADNHMKSLFYYPHQPIFYLPQDEANSPRIQVFTKAGGR